MNNCADGIERGQQQDPNPFHVGDTARLSRGEIEERELRGKPEQQVMRIGTQRERGEAPLGRWGISLDRPPALRTILSAGL